MPKKSESHNENKGRSRMQGRGQKASREERLGNANDSRQQIREEKLDKVRDIQQKVREEKSGNVSDYRQQIREKGSGNISDYRQQIREKKLAEGNKKNGCFPKLFMLVLPFIAIGIYVFLGS